MRRVAGPTALLVALLAGASVAHGQRTFPGGIHPKHDDRIGPRLPRPDHGAAGSDSAGSILALELFAGTLPAQGGAPLSTDAQRRLLRLLTATAADDAGWWVDRLGAPGNGETRAKALVLATSARGLLAAPRRLAEVVAAYNAFVDASSAQFLGDPPPEFFAMQAVLMRLVAERRARGAEPGGSAR